LAVKIFVKIFLLLFSSLMLNQSRSPKKIKSRKIEREREVKEERKNECKSLHFVERWWRWLKGHCSRYFFNSAKQSLKLAIHKEDRRRRRESKAYLSTFSILRSKSVSKMREKFYWHQNRVENSVTAIEIKKRRD
jgi:hypothetical protein